MALSDLAVFSEWVNTSATEVLRQQVELFNAASRGTILLRAAPIVGDYSDSAFWANVDGLVRRRNPYGSGPVAEKSLAQVIDTIVKIASGTPPVRIDPGQFRWIQKNPAEGGAVLGQQLAVQQMADMLNTSLMALVAAMSGDDAEIGVDGSAATADFSVFNEGQALFGDKAQNITAWVSHSKPLFDIYGKALTNAQGLFSFGDIKVMQDGFGRPFIITDSESLVDRTPDPDLYTMLGLVPGAVEITTNGDFEDNVETMNGDENITRTYQAEWSYNLGIKGYAWDKVNGQAAPNNAALAMSTNWDRIVTSHKDLPGVMVTVR